MYTCYVDKKVVGEETRSYGVDFGPHLIVHMVDKNHVVLKSKGHMGWSGRSEQSYREATFYVFKILEHLETRWHLEMILEFPVR